MMTTLLIDLGNSRLKWAWHTGTSPLSGMALDYRGQDLAQQLDTAWSAGQRPARVLVASVSHSALRDILSHWLTAHWQISPTFLVSPAQGQGIRNAYAEPAQLGCDRWAAMVAAYQLEQAAVCVVDCGSAVTLDVVRQDGQHLGGLILPGLTAMHSALSGHTALASVAATSEASAELLGCSTRDGIVLGIRQSIAGLVQQSLATLNARQGIRVSCYLTGGDAELISRYLTMPYKLVPDLVLQGLAVIADAT